MSDTLNFVGLTFHLTQYIEFSRVHSRSQMRPKSVDITVGDGYIYHIKAGSFFDKIVIDRGVKFGKNGLFYTLDRKVKFKNGFYTIPAEIYGIGELLPSEPFVLDENMMRFPKYRCEWAKEIHHERMMRLEKYKYIIMVSATCLSLCFLWASFLLIGKMIFALWFFMLPIFSILYYTLEAILSSLATHFLGP